MLIAVEFNCPIYVLFRIDEIRSQMALKQLEEVLNSFEIGFEAFRSNICDILEEQADRVFHLTLNYSVDERLELLTQEQISFPDQSIKFPNIGNLFVKSKLIR